MESTKQEIDKVSTNTDKCSLQKCVFNNERETRMKHKTLDALERSKITWCEHETINK